jgi:hypothetical protein
MMAFKSAAFEGFSQQKIKIYGCSLSIFRFPGTNISGAVSKGVGSLKSS